MLHPFGGLRPLAAIAIAVLAALTLGCAAASRQSQFARRTVDGHPQWTLWRVVEDGGHTFSAEVEIGGAAGVSSWRCGFWHRPSTGPLHGSEFAGVPGHPEREVTGEMEDYSVTAKVDVAEGGPENGLRIELTLRWRGRAIDAETFTYRVPDPSPVAARTVQDR